MGTLKPLYIAVVSKKWVSLTGMTCVLPRLLMDERLDSDVICGVGGSTGESPPPGMRSDISRIDDLLDFRIRRTPALLNLSKVPLIDRRVLEVESTLSEVIVVVDANPYSSVRIRSSAIDVVPSSSLAVAEISAGNFSLNRSLLSEYRKISFSACDKRGQPRIDMPFMLSKSFARTSGDGFW